MSRNQTRISIEQARELNRRRPGMVPLDDDKSPHKTPGQPVGRADAVALPRPDWTLSEEARREKLNKTESEWLAHLEALRRRGDLVYVGVQNLTLRLADRTRYTPDFWTIDNDGRSTLWDTKGGFIREDSIIKIRTAANQFRMFNFMIAQKSHAKWKTTLVRP